MLNARVEPNFDQIYHIVLHYNEIDTPTVLLRMGLAPLNIIHLTEMIGARMTEGPTKDTLRFWRAGNSSCGVAG